MINRTQYIMVGEPWDFASPDGENIINGSVIHVYSSKCLVFKANYELVFKQVKGDTLVLFPRYVNEIFDDNKTLINVNGRLFLGQFDNDIREEDMKKLSEFVMIGCLRSK